MEIILDEGYQFGLGVFETVSIEHQTPVLLDWHLERLHNSLRELGITQCVSKNDVLDYLRSQTGDHQALKIMVSEKNKLFTMRPNPYTPEQKQKGFHLIYSSVYRNETSPLVRHKTMNYGDCILEKRRARSLGADEQIFLNSRGEICEGTTTNIFFALDGRLYTPPVACGLLPGVLRRFIMEHFPVREQILKKEEVLQMDECFVTNSLMGIMPVKSLDKKTYPTGKITKICMDEYEKLVSLPS